MGRVGPKGLQAAGPRTFDPARRPVVRPTRLSLIAVEGNIVDLRAQGPPRHVPHRDELLEIAAEKMWVPHVVQCRRPYDDLAPRIDLACKPDEVIAHLSIAMIVVRDTDGSRRSRDQEMRPGLGFHAL